MQEQDKIVEFLEELINIRKAKSGEYGNVTEIKGKVLKEMFPNGLALESAKQFSRYSLLDFIISKTIRYANNFENGGHIDSLDDISIYCQMLKKIDLKDVGEKSGNNN